VTVDAFNELIAPAFGSWTPFVLVVTGVVVWLVNKLPGWLSRRSATVHGSPSSPKYWRARYAEALSQHDESVEDAERAQLAARITEARIMVEAHEAKRRVGIGGAVPMWFLVGVSGAAAVMYLGLASSTDNPVMRWWGIVFVAVMIVAEVAALYASSIGADRFNVLVAAGRAGHSDLVRQDPWQVLREHDHARYAQRETWKTSLKKRQADDQKNTSARMRFERALTGISPFESGIGLPADIWSSSTQPANNSTSEHPQPCQTSAKK